MGLVFIPLSMTINTSFCKNTSSVWLQDVVPDPTGMIDKRWYEHCISFLKPKIFQVPKCISLKQGVGDIGQNLSLLQE